MLKHLFVYGSLIMGMTHYSNVEAQEGFRGPLPESPPADENRGGFGPPPPGEPWGQGGQRPWGQNGPSPAGPQNSFREPTEKREPEGNFGQRTEESNRQPFEEGPQRNRKEEFPQRERNVTEERGGWGERGKEEPREAATREEGSNPSNPQDISRRLLKGIKKAWPQSFNAQIYPSIYKAALDLAVATMSDYASKGPSGSDLAKLLYSSRAPGRVIYHKEYRRAYIMVRFIQAWLNPDKYANSKTNTDIGVWDAALKSSFTSAYWDADIRRVVTGMYKEVFPLSLSRKVERFLCSSEEVQKQAPQAVEKRCRMPKAPASERR